VAGRAFARATGVAAVLAVAVGAVGTVATRGWGRVPFAVPARPWYLSWPYYLFWEPRFDLGWAMVALPTAVLAAAVVVGLAGAPLPRRVRVAGLAGCLFALALAVAALGGGPAAWRAPLAYVGEYPGAVDRVGAIPTFLREFAARQPTLPDFPAQHPPGAMVFYELVARVWPGLTGAALATVAAACLGAFVVAGLARDELGEEGERLATACWVLAPVVVLYVATSADGMWAPVLAGAALAAHRGLERRSVGWTGAGGGLLWAASMLSFAAVLVLPFLLVRALARLRSDRRWVLGWAAATAAVVLGLTGLCWAATGYEPVSAVRGVQAFWVAAPGSQRVWWIWLPGDLLAFGGMLGFPLLAAFAVRAWAAVRERAWGSFEVATLASLVAGAAWGHTKGEVERMWQFLVPFAIVVAARQLTRWRATLPVVAACLLAQAVAVQVLFFTRW
jgi:hypothetical protein